MKRRLLKIAGYLLAPALIAVVAVVILTREQTGEYALSGLNEVMAGIGIKAELGGKLVFQPFRPGFLWDKPVLGLNGREVVRADKIDLSLKNLAGLAYGNVEFDELNVEGLKVDFQSSPGRPEERKPSDQGGILEKLKNSPLKISFNRIHISGTELKAVVGKDLSVEVNGLDLLVVPAADHQYKAVLSLGAGEVLWFGNRMPFERIAVSAGLPDSTDKPFSLEKLEFVSPGLMLDASSTEINPYAKTGRIDVMVQTKLDVLKDRIKGFPEMQGRVAAAASITELFDSPRVEGFAEIESFDMPTDNPGETLNLEAAYLPFIIDKSGGIFDGAKFAIGRAGIVTLYRGRLLFDEHLSCDWRISLEGTTLHEIMAGVSFPNVPYRMDVEGTANLTGTIIPLIMEGDFNYRVKTMTVLTGGWRDPPGAHATVLETKRPGTAIGRIGCYSDRFEIIEAVADNGNTRVKVHDVFGYDNVIRLHYWSDSFDMKDVDPIMGIHVIGRGPIDVKINIIKNVPEIIASFASKDLTVEGIRLGESQIKIGFAGKTLRFYDGVFQTSDSSFEGDFLLDFGQRPTFISSHARTEYMDVRDLMKIIGLNYGLGDDLRGAFSGGGDFSGRIGDFDGNLNIRFEEFGIPAQMLGTGRAEITARHNQVKIDRLEFGKLDGKVDISGDLKDWSILDLKIKSQDWRLSCFDFLKGYLRGRDAPLDLEGAVAGELIRPRVSGKASFMPMVLDGVKYGAGVVEISLEPDKATAEVNLFGGDLKGKFTQSFGDGRNAAFHLEATELAYAPLAARLAGVPATDGVLTGAAEFRFPSNDPNKLDGEVYVERLDGVVKGLKASLVGETRIKVDAGTALFGPVEIEGSNFSARLDGRLDPGRGLEIAAKGLTRLEPLAQWSTSIVQAEGRAAFDLIFDYDFKASHLTGKALVENGFVQTKFLPEPFENISGKIIFDDKRLVFQDFNAAFSGGRINAGGTAQINLISGAGVDSLDLDAELKKCSYKLADGMEPVLSGNLTLKGTPWPLTLSGELKVDELEYMRSIRWQKAMLVDKVRDYLTPRRSRANPEDVHDKLLYNIVLKADDTIHIKNNLAELELRADLMLTGGDSSPGLLNTLSADGGTIYFQQNPFEVRRFLIEFTEKDRIRPTFDIEGRKVVTYVSENEQKEVTITMILKGDLDQPEILLTSDSDLSQTDLVSILVLGEPSATDTQNQANSSAAGIGFIGDVSGVNDAIRNRFKLDEFRMTTDSSDSNYAADSNLVPRLIVGKRITDRVYLTFSTAIMDETIDKEKSLGIRYRWSYFTIQGQWDSDAVKPEGDIGFDLKFNYAH